MSDIKKQIEHVKYLANYFNENYFKNENSDDMPPDWLQQDADKMGKSVLATLKYIRDNIEDIRSFQKQQGLKMSKAPTHCAITCKNQEFHDYLKDIWKEKKFTDTLPDDREQASVVMVRAILCLSSRADLARDKAAFKRWRNLYDGWMLHKNYNRR